MIKKIFVYTLLIIIIVLAFIFSQVPSHDKNWERESQILPVAALEGNVVTIENVRDFKYSDSSITDYDYTTRTFDINDIQSVHFIVEPFSTWKAVGHIFLTFDIADQEPLAFSVEARREEGENFSASQGLFNKFELWYVWGQETDLIARRAVYLDHPLHMYKLDIETETTQNLFKELIKSTIKIEHEPRFYNTLFSNCTNILAKFSNQNIQGSIPFHYSLFLTGYSDEYLYELELIKHDVPFEEIEQGSYITDIVKESYQDKDFSQKLRDSLE